MTYSEGLTFEEKVASLSQLDPLIAIQFFETFRRKTYLEPERLLMLAVLEDAVTCLVKYASSPSGRNKRLFDDTRAWIVTQDDDWPFSFNNVCDNLKVDAGYLRRGLLRMADKRRAEVCKARRARPPESARKGGKERTVRAAA